ncbi:aldehyde dehydrogenase [Planosporangium thailandense]|uniref:Aldehyde dehydrogenase n=1 Tax=Planosporangium thailandense TaxID=765197 RepID=A0ABX0Y7J1_9ACTN|nr:aldehyde dehydrogenase [Planosporangium thailandense]NJC73249.1 aldehyde dehydrogenase [Planosporangium thailandense]
MTSASQIAPSLPDTIRTQAFIDGHFVDALDGATFESLAPATGQVIATISACGEADVDRAVKAARAAFNRGDWSRKSPAERKAVLLRFADLIKAASDELATTEAIDAGKPIADCRNFDIPDVLNTIRWYAEAADKVFGKTSPTGDDHVGLIVREPVGVVGGVLPWNFPMAMLAWKIGPALATGNSVVIKPPELASLTTLRMAELAQQAGVPDGVFNVVPGLGHIAGKALGLHPDVDMITFTGSTEVGREFLRYSANSNLKGVVLEMGGKSPQIVMADCRDSLDEVAADLAEAAFWNAGQNCSAGSRILVEASIKDDFLAALAREADKRVVGEPTDDRTAIGPLIEASALDRVLGYVEQARSDGATIVTGGKRLLRETGGWFIGATVISDVTPQMSVAREEIFGPVVSVLTFNDVDEALTLANDTTYGLAATVWSKNIDVALRTARGIRAGTVAVNGYSEGDITTPFGGYRQSGFGGRDNGLEALEQYTETKTIWITLH